MTATIDRFTGGQPGPWTRGTVQELFIAGHAAGRPARGGPTRPALLRRGDHAARAENPGAPASWIAAVNSWAARAIGSRGRRWCDQDHVRARGHQQLRWADRPGDDATAVPVRVAADGQPDDGGSRAARATMTAPTRGGGGPAATARDDGDGGNGGRREREQRRRGRQRRERQRRRWRRTRPDPDVPTRLDDQAGRLHGPCSRLTGSTPSTTGAFDDTPTHACLRRPRSTDYALAASELEGWTARLIERLGTPTDIAADVAVLLSASDRRGIASHGTARLPQYVALVEAGVLDPAARPEIVRATGRDRAPRRAERLGPSRLPRRDRPRDRRRARGRQLHGDRPTLEPLRHRRLVRDPRRRGRDDRREPDELLSARRADARAATRCSARTRSRWRRRPGDTGSSASTWPRPRSRADGSRWRRGAARRSAPAGRSTATGARRPRRRPRSRALSSRSAAPRRPAATRATGSSLVVDLLTGILGGRPLRSGDRAALLDARRRGGPRAGVPRHRPGGDRRRGRLRGAPARCSRSRRARWWWQVVGELLPRTYGPIASLWICRLAVSASFVMLAVGNA